MNNPLVWLNVAFDRKGTANSLPLRFRMNFLNWLFQCENKSGKEKNMLIVLAVVQENN
jgi:hypothetical protein